MGALTSYGKNLVLDSGLPANLYAALHTGEPGADGTANEVAGGTPAYARKMVTLAAASDAARSITAEVVFDVPAAGVVAFVSLWTAQTGGSCVSIDDVPSESYTGQGTYTLTGLSLSI